jgi:hypothetical protein
MEAAGPCRRRQGGFHYQAEALDRIDLGQFASRQEPLTISLSTLGFRLSLKH